MEAMPVQVGWEEAVEVIRGRLPGSEDLPARPVIGVTGPVGSGKSTLAQRLSSCVIRTDDFLPDYALVPYAERDDPAHADLDLLASVLDLLRSGRSAEVPVWSHHSHRREGTRMVEPSEVIVCEGIHALHARVLHAVDVRVYVEAPALTRWLRWERIERAGQRGWGVEEARRYFEAVAEPAFAAHGAGARARSHVVVVNDWHGSEAPGSP